MFRYVDVLRQCLSICILEHILPGPDIRPISIQIPYYTNVRKLSCYYDMFKSISFAHTCILRINLSDIGRSVYF